jgi:hypothetical protein
MPGSVLTPVSLVAPDTVDLYQVVPVSATFSSDLAPCHFLNVISWTIGSGLTIAWSGRAAPTQICEPPKALWTAYANWRTADMPPHLGKALLIACGPDGVAVTHRVIVRLVDRQRGDTLPTDPLPVDEFNRLEGRIVQTACAS